MKDDFVKTQMGRPGIGIPGGVLLQEFVCFHRLPMCLGWRCGGGDFSQGPFVLVWASSTFRQEGHRFMMVPTPGPLESLPQGDPGEGGGTPLEAGSSSVQRRCLSGLHVQGRGFLSIFSCVDCRVRPACPRWVTGLLLGVREGGAYFPRSGLQQAVMWNLHSLTCRTGSRTSFLLSLLEFKATSMSTSISSARAPDVHIVISPFSSVHLSSAEYCPLIIPSPSALFVTFC